MIKVAVLWAIITGVLKLAGVLAWSWWTVFGPAAVLVATVVLLLAIGGGLVAVAAGLANSITKKQKK